VARMDGAWGLPRPTRAGRQSAKRAEEAPPIREARGNRSRDPAACCAMSRTRGDEAISQNPRVQLALDAAADLMLSFEPAESGDSATTLRNPLPEVQVEEATGMDIVLVYPPTRHKVAWLFSLPCLGGYLKRKDYSVAVIDAPFLEMGVTETINEIKRLDPLAIGVSIPLTDLVHEGREFLKVVRNAFPNKIVLCGGIHPTLVPEDVALHCDAVVVGEGELTTEEILHRLKEGKDFHDVPGLCYVGDNGALTFTEPRPPAPNLDDLGPPDWSLIPFQNWDKRTFLAVGNQFTLPMYTSRGCPFDCAFCANAKLTGRRVRFRSVELVVDEMEKIVKDYGVRSFFFEDEVFTLKPERVEQFCDELDRRRLSVRWSCQTRADCVREESIARIRRSGCEQIGFGLESADPEILRIMRKELDLDKVREGVRFCKKHNLWVNLSSLIGVPGETVESVRKTLRFLEECDPDFPYCFCFVPYPGTDLFDTALEQGGFRYIRWAQTQTRSALWDPPYQAPGLKNVPLPLILDVVAYRILMRTPYRLMRLARTAGWPRTMYMLMRSYYSMLRLRRRGVRL